MPERAHNLYSAGISYENVPPEIIGRFGMPQTACTFAESAAGDCASEILILSTCNRVEVYFAADSDAAIKKVVEKIWGENADDFAKICSIKKNADAADHLFAVASGLKSQMTGETEILGQVKAAYERAHAAGHCAGVLNALFQKAIHCAKWVRTNTEIGRGKISVGSVCAELALRIFDNIGRAKILLLGSGEVGKLVSDALFVRGAADITVCSRTRENADKLAEKIGCRSADIQTAIENLEYFDIVLCASSSKEFLITEQLAQSAVSKRRSRPIFLIDLAVPYNIEPTCGNLDGAFLYTLADLSKIANENIAARKAEIERAENAVRERADALAKKLGLGM